MLLYTRTQPSDAREPSQPTPLVPAPVPTNRTRALHIESPGFSSFQRSAMYFSREAVSRF